MFFLSQVTRNIRRNLFRSTLTFAISFLLLSFLGIYMGSIARNQETLNGLAQSIPVEFQVMSLDGAAQIGLEISTAKIDSLLSSDIKKPVYTAQAGGNYELINRGENVKACDTVITAANDFAAFPSISAQSVSWSELANSDFLTGSEPLCVVSKEFAASHGIELGDIIEFPLYTFQYDRNGVSFQFIYVSEAKLKVIGAFVGERDTGASNSTDVVVPVSWLRTFAEEHGITFYYDLFRANVKNPLYLNDFKSDMEEKGFLQVRADAGSARSGDAVVIQDKVFIETATTLQEGISTLESFRVPVFIFVILLILLITFLLMRNRKYEIAIASSVGQSKMRSALGLFAENVALTIMGAALSIILLILIIGIRITDAVFIFLLCSIIGVCGALFLLLRFDVLSLLTKID